MKQIVRWLNRHPSTLKINDGDEQAHRVFRMEADICGISVSETNPDYLRQILSNACRTYRVPKPELHFVSKRNQEYGWTTKGGIYLNRKEFGQNIITLLHELAHWIIDKREYAVDDHGPEFMWIYLELLDQYKILPRECGLLLCKKYNIEVG